MSELVTTTASVNKELILKKYGGMGGGVYSEADLPQKYLQVNKDSGVITITGVEQPLKEFNMTILYSYKEWAYWAMDGMSVVKHDLISAKNRNIGLKDNEVASITDYSDSSSVPTTRHLTFVYIVVIDDMESVGPVKLSVKRSNLWSAKEKMVPSIVENTKQGLPIFCQKYRVTSGQRTNKKNQKFYTFIFTPGDYINDEKRLDQYAALYKFLEDSQERLLHANESTEEEATPF